MMEDPWIVSRPDLLGGKPCIRGTRLSVELLLELLAAGTSREEILRRYPQLTDEAFRAALLHAARSLSLEVTLPVTAEE